VASLAKADAESLTEYVAGADAGLLPISGLSSKAKTIQKLSQVMPDIPWGGWLRDICRGGVEQIVKSGGDFIIFPAANTSLAMLQNEEVGRILEVEASLNEGLLRAVNELPVDAVLITGEHKEDYFLTIEECAQKIVYLLENQAGSRDFAAFYWWRGRDRNWGIILAGS